jgi:hypothetical protein
LIAALEDAEGMERMEGMMRRRMAGALKSWPIHP